MRIDSKYKLRTIAGENVILKQGRAGSELTNIIALNESAKLLFETLKDKEDFNEEDAAKVLIDNYQIDAELANRDAAAWFAKMVELGIVI